MTGVLLAGTSLCSAELEWLSKDYDFGVFREADGPVTGSVRFVNKGPGATFVSRVRPSCGCTGASYTEKMIEPGDTAEIRFTYNPTGRPGRFDKTVKVYTGTDNELTTVRIRGTVMGKSTTLETLFPIEAGDMRLDSPVVAFGEIKRGRSRHAYLNLCNQGTDTIAPSWEGLPEGLEVKLVPERIAPGEVGTLGLYLKTDDGSRLGPWEKEMILMPHPGSKSDRTAVTVKGTVVADTEKMTVEEIDGGPRAYLVPEFIDFGDVEGGRIMDFEFSVLNEGKTEMRVEGVHCRNQLVNITHIPKKIKPGKKGIVKGKINVSGLQDGAFRIGVDVITDDVLHPVRTANLVGRCGKGAKY